MNARPHILRTEPVVDLLAELRSLDIRLWSENGSLRYDAPAGVFSDALKARVRQHKAALLEHLGRAAGGDADAVSPLSCQQERMWFLNRLEGPRGLYVELLAFEMQGELDAPALAKALDWLLARHPVLRCVFRDAPHGPEMVTLASAQAELSRVDLSSLDKTDQAGEVARALEDFSRLSFDLHTGPVVRFRLIRLAEQRHVFALAAHHAVVDGWSGGLILDDLALAYNAFAQGEPPSAPAPETTYAAYAAAQRRQVDDGSLDGQARAWAGEMAGYPFTPGLPLDLPRPPVAAGHGVEVPLRLSPAEVAALGQAGRRQGATFFAVLLAAFAVVQARASGRRRLLIGVPTSGRTRPAVESVVGYFSNTVPVSLDLTGAVTFGDALAWTRDAVLTALSRQDRKSTRLNSSHRYISRMPSSA
jgi:non-ribosomal peptide synthetase component F